MKYIKLLWFDIRKGLLHNPMLFVVPLIVAVIACIDLTNQIASLNEFDYFDTQIKGSFADYLMFIYGGMDKYVPDFSNPFLFPVRWAVVFLALSFIILNYPFEDMQGFGQQILIRTKGRMVWWLSKCGWNLLSVIVYHALIFSVAALFCVAAKGSLSNGINKDLQYAVFQLDRASISSQDRPWSFAMLVLPVFFSIGINLFQMTLSLFIKPIFSFLVIAFLMISSAYALSPYLVGNYAMPVRYDLVMQEGVSITVGFAVSLLLILVSVSIGIIRFHQYDILNTDNEV